MEGGGEGGNERKERRSLKMNDLVTIHFGDSFISFIHS